jgi:hypothetical protein
MRNLLALLVVVIAACAPADHDLTPEAGPQAGSVALKTEALLPSCSASAFASGLRARINARTGTTWTWSSAPEATPWYGTASGGRTITAINQVLGAGYQDFRTRSVMPSQSSWFRVTCRCTATNQTTCWNGGPTGADLVAQEE